MNPEVPSQSPVHCYLYLVVFVIVFFFFVSILFCFFFSLLSVFGGLIVSLWINNYQSINLKVVTIGFLSRNKIFLSAQTALIGNIFCRDL